MRNDHFDAISGRMKTWPIGTTYQGTVQRVTSVLVIVIVEHEGGRREGYGLTGVDFTGIHAGQSCQIIFRDGGPTGGYWDFVRPSGAAS